MYMTCMNTLLEASVKWHNGVKSAYSALKATDQSNLPAVPPQPEHGIDTISAGIPWCAFLLLFADPCSSYVCQPTSLGSERLQDTLRQEGRSHVIIAVLDTLHSAEVKSLILSSTAPY